MKMGERFRDPHSGLTGLLYVVVKRVEAGEDFEPGDAVPAEALLVRGILTMTVTV